MFCTFDFDTLDLDVVGAFSRVKADGRHCFAGGGDPRVPLFVSYRRIFLALASGAVGIEADFKELGSTSVLV